MTMKKKPGAAEMLSKRLAATAGEKTQSVADSFGQAIGKRLEERGITRVPGLPDDEPQPEWYDLAIEHHRRHKELEGSTPCCVGRR
ncbi:hypothetical protein [Mycolicibacterium sp. CBMA 295]|uniref:hypothetical protein n=1 Tax=Mycolicibacterium sp. CBMA 295 TaxID=2606605 RepID=UPI0012DD2676|nr:hypothetical protein [Mycolicibacterium sp. CBMA 295]MUM29069.1 hypothetical protein [Mycolicibacterium sp. CBMA 295]